ncbi:MAG: organomercurial lyase MerB [Nocardiopsaceae bacterium]|nr:organomercurial lyase MerB [Nocardiopsaceae bacterium]
MDADIEFLTARLGHTLGAGDARLTVAGLWQQLLRLLARGEPVAIEALASATGHSAEQVRNELAARPDTEYDAAGRIIGYGITLNPTPHRFEVDGHPLYTWCALDTLMFPAVIDRPARVTSPCRATGQPVSVGVEPDRITGLDPAGAVVSIVAPEQCSSVRSDFCDEVHFFASRHAAAPWLDDRPEATVVEVAEAFTLGRRLAASLTAPPGDSCC